MVREAMVNRSWVRDIRGALTVQVILEYLTVWAKLENVTLGVRLDQVIWRWTRDGRFSTASAYKLFFSGQFPIPGAKAIRTGGRYRCATPPAVRLWRQKARTDVLGGQRYRPVSPNPPYSQRTPRMDVMPTRPTTSHLPPALGARCREEDEPPQDRAPSLEASVSDPPPIRSSEQLGPVVELEVRPPEGAEEPSRPRAHVALSRNQGSCLLPRFRSPGEGVAPCSHDEISAAATSEFLLHFSRQHRSSMFTSSVRSLRSGRPRSSAMTAGEAHRGGSPSTQGEREGSSRQAPSHPPALAATEGAGRPPP
jgi:hypothetical protein